MNDERANKPERWNNTLTDEVLNLLHGSTHGEIGDAPSGFLLDLNITLVERQ